MYIPFVASMSCIGAGAVKKQELELPKICGSCTSFCKRWKDFNAFGKGFHKEKGKGKVKKVREKGKGKREGQGKKKLLVRISKERMKRRKGKKTNKLK